MFTYSISCSFIYGYKVSLNLQSQANNEQQIIKNLLWFQFKSGGD